MARFATKSAHTAPSALKAPSSIGFKPRPVISHQGGIGYVPSNAEAELFNAAVSGMLADGFYESGDARVKRITDLIPKCDPSWLRSFIPWLRTDAHMRSAPVVIAAEYAACGFDDARKVVASSMQRADEPGEMLAYWHATYGRKLPAAIKRGIADAAVRLYTERSMLRYDGSGKLWRFGDVIEVVHPKPASPTQTALFKFCLDRRRHTPVADPGVLSRISRTLMLEDLPAGARGTERLALALADPMVEFSWERASGWLGRKLTAADWAALIPSMGYMAVLRNLNNFDRAGLHGALASAKLNDMEALASSRVLPFRFQTAYKNLEADTYKVAVASAADAALANLPEFPGHTLIMVDVSPSMNSLVGGGKSNNPLRLCEAAGFMAEALGRRCEDAMIVSYDTRCRENHKPLTHQSILRAAADPRYAPLGNGTHTWEATEQAVSLVPGLDRIVVITDEQSQDSDRGVIRVPVITWNIAGYQPHHAAHGSKNRYFVAGYNDTVMQTLPAVIAHGSTGKWPWE